MMKRFLTQLMTGVAIVMLLSSCGSAPEKDRAPSRSEVPDISQIPDAIPKKEPRSKYGNPRQYEVFGKTYYTLNTAEGYDETGIASWYGKKFHGRRTSSGEVYDMYKMTAAHKTLPLPTYVEVTNLNNGRKVIVKVNDRGPFHKGRIIDLSYTAATKLDIIRTGTGKVRVRTIMPEAKPEHTIINTPVPTEPALEKTQAGNNIYLQVGAFASMQTAADIKTQLESAVSETVSVIEMQSFNTILYRVRIGPLASVSSGDELANNLKQTGFHDSHLVIE